MEKSKAFHTSELKRIKHHKTIFTTNSKGTSIGRKHKRRKRPTQNKPKTIKKMVIGPHVHVCSIPSVMSDSLWPYGLYPTRFLYPLVSPGKNNGVGWQALLQGIFPTQESNSCLLHQITLLNPLSVIQLFYIVRLIMFLVWLTSVIIFYFLSGYWLWILRNIFYYCGYVTIISLILLYHDSSTENNRILYH